MKTPVGAAEPPEKPTPQVSITVGTLRDMMVVDLSSLTVQPGTTRILTNAEPIVWSHPVNFICESCRTGDHTSCPGGTQCDCQHRGQK